MINATDNPRNKAFLAVLYYSDGRIGEIISLRIKELEIDEHCARPHVYGKTGERKITIIGEMPFLCSFLDQHTRAPISHLRAYKVVYEIISCLEIFLKLIPELDTIIADKRKRCRTYSMKAGKKACVLTLGCPESRIDSARIQLFLQKNNYTITRKVKEADLILFRTCGLTKINEERSLKAIRKIQLSKKNDSTFIAWGCLSKINLKGLRREYRGLTFGEVDEEILNKIVQPEIPFENIYANELMSTFKTFKNPTGLKNILSSFYHYASMHAHPIIREEKFWGSPFFIKVSSGCLGGCTYCAVKKSRGSIHSKSIDKVVVEFKNGLDNGYKDFRLLATDLGSYGRDKGCKLVDLLTRMIEEEGRYVISLRNVNPGWFIEMYDDIKPILSSGKIRYISSAFQSGSNRILQLMGRGYTIEKYKECFQDLSRRYPNILLGTQVMVGFPTETAKDFRLSEKILREINFERVGVYRYSSRSGTPAAKMDGQVPEYIKIYRFLRLFFVFVISKYKTKASTFQF